MKHILVIDDDIHIGNILEEALSRSGYSVLRAYSGTESLLLLEKNKPDMILLDMMLPGLDGEELLPLTEGIPVIVVSARTETDDKVNMLMKGACDYITKPFEIKELLARIAVQFRKISASGPSGMLSCGDIELDTSERSVVCGSRSVRLTPTECAILKQLMINHGNVVTRSSLLDSISIDTPDCTESSLKVHISNLRKKLRKITERSRIEAVWGIGFILH